MRVWPLSCLVLLILAACLGPHPGNSGHENDVDTRSTSDSGPVVIAYWRPISEPNVEMPLDKLQKKLNFDLSQCQCGIYPEDMTHSEAAEFQPDKQRLAQTSVTVAPNKKGECMTQPSMVVTECMRGRGWEPTSCSGRMPLANGGSLCAPASAPATVN